MATKIRASNLHTDVKTMVTTMVGENALDSAEANLLIDAKFTANSTDVLSEGSTNLYFTNARADARAQLKIDALVGSAPGSLDTLQELGDALGDDPNFATTVTNSIATKLPLAGGTMTGNLTLTSTASGSSASPELELRRDITGADANYLGQIKFTADNDADQNVVFAKITGKILDASDGTEDGIIEFAHQKAGSNNISARFRSDSLQLINGTNLTVAGTTVLTGNLTVNTNALYVDTSNNRVGVGTSNPVAQFAVGGAGRRIEIQGTDAVIRAFDRSASWSEMQFEGASYTFDTSGTERMRINSSGNVGIGTVSPAHKLDVAGTSRFTNTLNVERSDGTFLQLKGNSNNTGYINWESNGFTFYTNGPVEALRIGSSGIVVNEDSRDYDFRVESNNNANMLFVDGGNDRIGVATSNPLAVLDIHGNTNAYSTMSKIYLTDLSGHANSRNWSIGNGGSDYGNFTIGVSNAAGGDPQASGTHFNPFLITKEGNVVFNEDSKDADFRVESNNNSNMLKVDGGAEMVCFGTSNNTGLAVQNSETGVQITSSGRIFCSNADHHDFNRTSNGDIIRFRRDTTVVGTISSTTAGTTYSTTSDRRLKNNIEPIADATDKLMDMKPVTHTWIDNPESPQVHGFIAQEMQEVVPEAVSGDAESDEMMSMDYGRITPVIVAALQDALNEIKELKTRIDELENN
jgi:hypothetical protein